MQIQAFPDELFPFNEIQDEAILEAFPNETQDEQTHELLPFNGTQEDEISVSTVTNLRNGDLGFDPYEEVGKKVDMSLFDKFENVQLKIDRATVDLNNSFEIKKETIACTTCGRRNTGFNTKISFLHVMRTHQGKCAGCDLKKPNINHFFKSGKSFCRHLV